MNYFRILLSSFEPRGAAEGEAAKGAGSNASLHRRDWSYVAIVVCACSEAHFKLINIPPGVVGFHAVVILLIAADCQWGRLELHNSASSSNCCYRPP